MLAAAVLGFFVVTLDAVVVNVALPAIRRDFSAGITGLQWVVDGYTLMFAALLLWSGALSDRIGARRERLPTASGASSVRRRRPRGHRRDRNLEDAGSIEDCGVITVDQCRPLRRVHIAGRVQVSAEPTKPEGYFFQFHCRQR